jgi:nitrite reductase (NO-forming)
MNFGLGKIQEEEKMRNKWAWLLLVAMAPALAWAAAPAETETAAMTFAPNVPPAITRRKPALVKVAMMTQEKVGALMEGIESSTTYKFWTFNGHVPGPFIRVRVGDTVEVTLTNPKESGMVHNVDFHAVTGPGGGAVITAVAPGESKTGRFKMLNPGLYIYHCAAPPVADHIANGIYGLILVEPEKGLPKVDKEYYVMQSEFYTVGEFGDEGLQTYSPDKGAAEKPTYVVFNGKVGSLQGAGALKANVGDTVRVYFGNIGPNLISSFHIIGTIFDTVYREGSLSEPTHNVQTTVVPAGSASVIELRTPVPGNFTLVDHAIFRIQKGALGTLSVAGPDAPDIYQSIQK